MVEYVKTPIVPQPPVMVALDAGTRVHSAVPRQVKVSPPSRLPGVLYAGWRLRRLWLTSRQPGPPLSLPFSLPRSLAALLSLAQGQEKQTT